VVFKLGIEDTIPDHSVFCRARHERFRESNAFRRVFERVVASCIAAGLVDAGRETATLALGLFRWQVAGRIVAAITALLVLVRRGW
jgi:hypothetical protein